MNTESAIVLTGDFTKGEALVTQGITAQRDAAIEKAKMLPKIAKNSQDLDKLRRSFVEMGEIEKVVIACRKSLKAPIDALGKSLLRCEEEFLGEMQKLRMQIGGEINNYQSRQIERQRVDEKRIAAEQAAKQAEADKAAKEAEALKAKLAPSAPQMTAEEMEAIEDALLEKQLAAEVVAPLVPALTTEVRGVTSRQAFDYKLKGRTEAEQQESLYAFAQAFPHLCKIEVRRRETLEALNDGKTFKSAFPEEQPMPPDWVPRPPGLEVFTATKTSIR
jgi:hypothetical protein